MLAAVLSQFKQNGLSLRKQKDFQCYESFRRHFGKENPVFQRNFVRRFAEENPSFLSQFCPMFWLQRKSQFSSQLSPMFWQRKSKILIAIKSDVLARKIPVFHHNLVRNSIRQLKPLTHYAILDICPQLFKERITLSTG